MSKFLKFFLVLLVLIAAAGIVFLQVLKPRLSDYIKEALNRSVEARVDYSKVDISLFRAFPGVSVTLKDLKVLGEDPEISDTLAAADKFSVAFDALSIFSGEFKVHSLRIERPKVFISKDSTGKSNWDIFPAAGSAKAGQDDSGFNLLLSDFKIRDGFIAFYDSTNGSSFQVDGFNHEMKGRLSGRSSTIRTNNTVNSLSVVLGGVSWLQKAGASFNAEIDADLENKKFVLKDNRLGLNDLGIVFDGTISVLDDAVAADLDFRADKAAFKQLLSLLPAMYENNYQKLDAQGTVALTGRIKGMYKKKMLPAFELALDVSNGSFGYEGVPVRAEEIVFGGRLTNPGGEADKTSLSIPELTMKINGKPFVARLDVMTPVSDPYIDASINGTLNLSDFQQIYPIKNLRLSGELQPNVTVKGNLSAFNAGGASGLRNTEAYGSVVAKGLKIASDTFAPDIAVPSAQLKLSPGYIDLVELRAGMGESDFSATGKLENYIAFIMKKGDLKGSVDVRSGFVKLDEFQNLEEEKKVLLLPANVSMQFNGIFNSVQFGDMQFERARGGIVLKDEKLDFKDITAETLGGRVTINGYYSTKGGEPDTEFSITAAEMNVARSYKSIELLEKVAPVAEYAKGDVSAKLNMRSRLDENLQPVPETISGKGRVETAGLVVEDFPPIRKLALLLDVNALDTLRVPETAIDFAVEKGLVTTEPFSFTVNDIAVSASGITGFDKSLDWKIGLEIPKKYIGKAGVKTITGLLQKLPLKSMDFSLPDTVIVDASLKGSVTKPEIGLDLRKTADRIALRLRESLQQKVTDELRDRFLPGSEVDTGGVTDVLKKAAGDILFNKKQQPSENGPDSAGKEKTVLPSIIENIFAPSKKQPANQGEATDMSETVNNGGESGKDRQSPDALEP